MHCPRSLRTASRLAALTGHPAAARAIPNGVFGLAAMVIRGGPGSREPHTRP